MEIVWHKDPFDREHKGLSEEISCRHKDLLRKGLCMNLLVEIALLRGHMGLFGHIFVCGKTRELVLAFHRLSCKRFGRHIEPLEMVRGDVHVLVGIYHGEEKEIFD